MHRESKPSLLAALANGSKVTPAPTSMQCYHSVCVVLVLEDLNHSESVCVCVVLVLEDLTPIVRFWTLSSI